MNATRADWSPSTQVRIGGYGGQGIVLTGLLLGRAACLYDGKEAVLTQSYGPEARGGASSTDVVIASHPIDYPLVTEPDVLVIFFQEAYTKFRKLLKTNGVLIIESNLVRPDDQEEEIAALPATRMAEALGHRIVANVVMLGFLTARTKIVSPESIEEAIRTTVKPKTVDLNLRAFEAGFKKDAIGLPS